MVVCLAECPNTLQVVLIALALVSLWVCTVDLINLDLHEVGGEGVVGVAHHHG
jgi:hypothetical protein